MIKLFITAVIGFVLIIVFINWAQTLPEPKSPPQSQPKPLSPDAVKWSVNNAQVIMGPDSLTISNGDELQQWPQLTVALDGAADGPKFGYMLTMPPLKPGGWITYKFSQFKNSNGYEFDPSVQTVNCVWIGGGKYNWQWTKFTEYGN